MLKIFLMGKQRAGKDTTADILVRKYGFKKYALAEGVYEVAKKYFGMKEKDRRLLIDIGEKMREIKPTVWTEYTWKRILKDNPERVVISDVRLRVEYVYLKKLGFIPVYIHAPQYIRTKRPGYNPEFENHRTENELNPKDGEYIINNVYTLDILEKHVDLLVASRLVATKSDLDSDLLKAKYTQTIYSYKITATNKEVDENDT